MSSNANANYTRIQAHGTASAFEPGFINQAATVGPPHGPVQTGSPYKVIDVTVDLTGAVSDREFIIGDALQQGCLIHTVSYDSNNTLDAGNQLAFGMVETVVGTPPEFREIAAFAPGITGGGDPADDPNGGKVFVGLKNVIPPVVPGALSFPAIKLSTANPSPIVLPASVSVKVFYICP